MNGGTPSARKALPADAEDSVLVLRESIVRSCVADHRNDPKTLELWLANKTTENFIRWLGNEDNHLIVAELDSRVCGVGAIARKGMINLCYVHPDAQRLGIGRLLLATLEAQALKWGLPKITLTSSLTARAFYEREGYVPSGEAVAGFGVTFCHPYEKALAP